MSNSSLVSYTALSPNHSGQRRVAITKITPHHMAGDLTVETCGKVFASPARQASANYGIGTDGRVALYVDESDHPWTSADWDNDDTAVTVEVANETFAPEWKVSDTAWYKLVDLCVDIVRRNPGIKRADGRPGLNYTGDRYGSLTEHQMFAPTACPGPYMHYWMKALEEAVNVRLDGEAVDPPVPPTPDAEPEPDYPVEEEPVPDVWLRAQCEDGTVLPWTKYPDFAGWPQCGPIVYMCVSCDWPIEVQGHTNASGWLSWLVNPRNIDDKVIGCVGDGTPLRGITMYLKSPNGDKVVAYQVSVGGDTYYSEQRDDEETNGQDGFAGDLVNPIYKVKARIDDL